MARSRFSIAFLAFAVALVAADAAALRFVIGWPDKRISGREPLGFILPCLPLATALGLGLPRLLGGQGGAFLRGFQALGWVAVLAWEAGCWFYPASASTLWVQPVFGAVWNALAGWSAFGDPSLTDGFLWLVMYPAAACCLSLPLWLFAVCGGLLFGLVARSDGRSRGAPPDPAEEAA